MINQKFLDKLKFTLILSSIFLIISCSFKPKIVSTGIVNLDEKQALLIVNQSNKNDVLNLLGQTVLIDPMNENLWTYVETQEIANFYGEKKLIKNNFLFLSYDQKGILKEKKTFNLKDINNLEFSNITTETYGLNKTIVSRFLYGIRKRYQSRQSNSQ